MDIIAPGTLFIWTFEGSEPTHVMIAEASDEKAALDEMRQKVEAEQKTKVLARGAPEEPEFAVLAAFNPPSDTPTEKRTSSKEYEQLIRAWANDAD